MESAQRVFAAIALWVTLGIMAHQVVQAVKPEDESARHRGLLWLRDEYRVPEENFHEIVKLHEEYFTRCDRMCAEMVEAHRPAAGRFSRRAADAASAAALEREKDLCERCLRTMMEHLNAVAALMPADEGKRFLMSILPELANPRELRDLRLQTAAPK
jgi:hypothetical protein